MKRGLEGIIIPAVTPFDQDGNLNTRMLELNICKWNETEISGYMCLGSNGEFRMLSDDESMEVIRWFARYKSPDKMLIAGVGRESLYHTLAFLSRVQENTLDIDYISVLTPHYFKGLMTEKALYEYYISIAEYSRYPLLLYCAPSFANGVCISGKLLKELAAHPNIAGIKDTSSDMMAEYMDVAGGRPDFQIISGSIKTLKICLERGGRVAVVSGANYFPEECAELLKLWKMGKKQEFQTSYQLLMNIIKATGARGSVAGVKCCMNLLGYQAGFPRKPLLPIEKAIEEEIMVSLRRYGKLGSECSKEKGRGEISLY